MSALRHEGMPPEILNVVRGRARPLIRFPYPVAKFADMLDDLNRWEDDGGQCRADPPDRLEFYDRRLSWPEHMDWVP